MLASRFLIAGALVATTAAVAPAQANLNDLEMTHVAVTASSIDIAYAHLALALSSDRAVREFAETMIRDHAAVNDQVSALARKLKVSAQDNAFSRQLVDAAARTKSELARLSGPAFDRAYLKNELAYHETVNGLVADTFIPAIKNAEVKQAFSGALAIFRAHEKHARQLVTETTR
jgi:putative membrane protein